ncbi:MAG TPA: lipid A deacylase LpxR family protein [Rhizomicrobium sp.]|jgi:lipid A 3-O-deacylase|nr:lipid A deacylase LpxR family protein [Rhizomicrobium sp.]
MRIPALIAGAVLLLPAQPVAAKDEPAGAFSLQFENDIFFDTDRHYTSGVALDYTTAPQDTPRWLQNFAHHLPFFASSGDVRTDYQLAQDIFTPANTQVAVPDPADRPYAGYLYVGLGLLSNSDTHLDQAQLQLGTIGPAALGEEAQNWVHGILGDKRALGWHFQLRDEPVANIFYERSWKLIPPRSIFGLFFDLEPHAGIAVGNAYDYVNAGAMARVGINLPDDFGPPRLEPSLPGSNFFEPNGAISAYLFGGVDGRAVGRNIFLDGNSFAASPSVDKRILVGDVQVGAALQLGGTRLSFTHVFRSKEFDTQPSADQFGSVNLSFRL